MSSYPSLNSYGKYKVYELFQISERDTTILWLRLDLQLIEKKMFLGKRSVKD